jgi:hypothetical protein
MKLRSVALFALALAIPALASAEIFRCQARNGTTTYQQAPCDDDAVGGIAAIAAEYPPVNTAERERILAREAALEKRLEARRDRELQEAALRVRMAERAPAEPLVVQQPSVGFVYVVPRAPHRRHAPRAPHRGATLR